jgi:hypothetical protein
MFTVYLTFGSLRLKISTFKVFKQRNKQLATKKTPVYFHTGRFK